MSAGGVLRAAPAGIVVVDRVVLAFLPGSALAATPATAAATAPAPTSTRVVVRRRRRRASSRAAVRRDWCVGDCMRPWHQREMNDG
jgi:hypothetical protein